MEAGDRYRQQKEGEHGRNEQGDDLRNGDDSDLSAACGDRFGIVVRGPCPSGEVRNADDECVEACGDDEIRNADGECDSLGDCCTCLANTNAEDGDACVGDADQCTAALTDGDNIQTTELCFTDLCADECWFLSSTEDE